MSINFFEFLKNAPSFLNVRDFFDVFIIAVLIYMVLVFIRQTRSFFVLSGILVLLGVWGLSRFFNLSLTRQIFQYFFTSFIVIFAVAFQKEIRKFFEWFPIAGKNFGNVGVLVSSKVTSIIISAVENLAKKKIGALIVLPGKFRLDNFLEGGLALGGQISLPLILSIFDSSSPGHDGAVIIEGEIIKKFGAHLPLAESFSRYGNLGTRHRAALGLAEKTDAYIIVVSEERGTITLAHDSELQEVSDIGELKNIVTGLTKERVPSESHPWKFIFLRNLGTKIISLAIAVFLWFLFIFQTGVINKDFLVPVEFKFLPNNVVVEGVNPNEISLTLSGDYGDFNNITSNDIKISFNASNFKEGWQRVRITPDIISPPPYLTVVNVNPKFFEYKLKTK